jgi:diketogulonate reductase-like aldo/keto reductase
MEAFKAAGKTRAIGVSHFCRSHLDDILAINTTAVALNQVQVRV